ncbi:UPAR/Ly6 domain-containing protein CG9338 [Aphomia sociella]
MARSVLTPLSIAVLLAVFEIGSCMKCYQCNSQSTPDCKDPFKNGAVTVVDCSTSESVNYNNQFLRGLLPSDVGSAIGAPRYCHKIVMETGTVIRACLDVNPLNINQTCQLLDAPRIVDPKLKLKYCGVCDKDKCNGAGSITASLPLAALALVASYFYCKQ